MTSLLNVKYKTIIRPAIVEKFNFTNTSQIPKLEKIQIGAALGLSAQNKTRMQNAKQELSSISGQHPKHTKAKKSIAGFKLREGVDLGLVVTLRREKMYSFLEKCILLVFPRIRDFQGLSTKGFDHEGNYSFGITDQLLFPELNFEAAEATRGFNITLVTSAASASESAFLLASLGLPLTFDSNVPQLKN